MFILHWVLQIMQPVLFLGSHTTDFCSHCCSPLLNPTLILSRSQPPGWASQLLMKLPVAHSVCTPFPSSHTPTGSMARMCGSRRPCPLELPEGCSHAVCSAAVISTSLWYIYLLPQSPPVGHKCLTQCREKTTLLCACGPSPVSQILDGDLLPPQSPSIAFPPNFPFFSSSHLPPPRASSLALWHGLLFSFEALTKYGWALFKDQLHIYNSFSVFQDTISGKY